MSSAPESAEILRKKLKFRSWHRGFKEMDLILGNYADQHLDAMGADQLAAYAAFLDMQDQELYDIIRGRAPAPDHLDAGILTTLKSFSYLRTDK